jgi:hypothetical protein
MHAIHHRHADIDGQHLFYRKRARPTTASKSAGPADAWSFGSKTG